MKREYAGQEYFLAVISKGRAAKAADMAFIGPATWYVPQRELVGYGGFVASGVIKPDGGNGVSGARNRALDDANKGDLPLVLLDDELGSTFQFLPPGPDQNPRNVSFEDAASALAIQVAMSPFRFGALTHISNKMWMRRAPRVQDRAVIQGGFLYVEPGPLRFNERLRFHEDLDFTLQHWLAYGGARRVNYIIPKFKRGTAGGVRTGDVQATKEEALGILMERWPGMVAPHPKDPGTPVLRKRRLS